MAVFEVRGRMIDKLKQLPAIAVQWFEFGDLLPLLIIVSSAHYISILSNHDNWFVAVAIGILVDLGHYRWVRAAARYSGSDKRQAAIRWLFAISMTVVSLAYHQRFYQDWWLSIPLPLLIASLAWLSKVDERVGKRMSPVVNVVTETAKELPKPEPQKNKIVKAGTNGKLDYANMTIDEIVKATGKSRRTAYRLKGKEKAKA